MPPNRSKPAAAAASTAAITAILLTTKGEVKKINMALEGEPLTLEAIQRVFKKKELPERIGYYEHERYVLSLFGYKKGKKGTENKTELPDPYAQQPLFGDAIVTASPMTASWEEVIPFTVEQWNAFYQKSREEDDLEEPDDEEAEEDPDAEFDEKEEEEVEEEEVEEDEEETEVELGGIEEVEEDEPESVAPVKRRRAPVYKKLDAAALKEDIAADSLPESNTLRMKCIAGFGFLKDFQFTEEDIHSLEKGIFDATFQTAQAQYVPRSWKSPLFSEIYRQFVRSILCNIHPASPVKNTRLLHRVQDGEFTLASLPFMSSYDMFPENWFAMKDKQLQREQKILEGNKSRATDQFKCRRCQKRECNYYELQTRSADEPMTIFITCLNCGKEWRQGG